MIFHCALGACTIFRCSPAGSHTSKKYSTGNFSKLREPFSGIRRINIFRRVYLHKFHEHESTSRRSTRDPVAAPRTKARLSSGRGDEMSLSPVQRMRQKIALADPELVRRIISDPALEQ